MSGSSSDSTSGLLQFTRYDALPMLLYFDLEVAWSYFYFACFTMSTRKREDQDFRSLPQFDMSIFRGMIIEAKFSYLKRL